MGPSVENIRVRKRYQGQEAGAGCGQEMDEAEKAAESRTDAPLLGIRSAVLTISDRCSHGESKDQSGVEAERALRELGASVGMRLLVSDHIPKIRSAVFELVREHDCRLVVTTGGTGVSPHDVTPEALESLWNKLIPGIGELLRREGGTAHSSRLSVRKRGRLD